jgi:hypothetical protein
VKKLQYLEKIEFNKVYLDCRTAMKLSTSLVAAVSVNFAVADVHTGPHPRYAAATTTTWEEAHMSMPPLSTSSAVHHTTEPLPQSTKAHKHAGNGGKHDSGTKGHHPGYKMSMSKSSKGKSHKTAAPTPHPKSSKALSHPVKKAKSIKSKASHSLPSKAAKMISSSKANKTTASGSQWVAPSKEDSMVPATKAEEILNDNTTTPEAQGTDTSVLKVLGNEKAVDVILTGGKNSHQAKIRDEDSVNLKEQEHHASLLSDTYNSSSMAVTSGVIAGGVCLLASAFYMLW